VAAAGSPLVQVLEVVEAVDEEEELLELLLTACQITQKLKPKALTKNNNATLKANALSRFLAMNYILSALSLSLATDDN
jgi:hypothetical protein